MPIASTDVDPWPAWDAISLLDPASLIGKDLHLYAFGWLRTEINNGGFHQLFFNSAGDVVPDAIDAARSAGITALAALLERAIEPLGSPYPRERMARQISLDRLSDDWLDESDSLDNEYYALEATVDLDAAMRSLLS